MLLKLTKKLNNHCGQKDIDYLDNSNITENLLGVEKLHLNRKVTVFTKNLLQYLNNV